MISVHHTTFDMLLRLSMVNWKDNWFLHSILWLN